MKKQKTIEEMKADYHLFMDIQMGKYLQKNNKNEFDSNDEAKDVIGKIINKWNEKIAVEKEKLDALDEAAKTGWFNSIEIEFNHLVTESLDPVITTGSVKPIGLIDKIFPELSNSQMELVPYCRAVLEPLGYKYDRMREIIAGIEPTEIEIELFRWAYEIVNIVNRAVKVKSAIKAEEIMDTAYYMACERLDKEAAKNVIIKIQKYLLKEIKKKKKK
jgi:hypothetical protein